MAPTLTTAEITEVRKKCKEAKLLYERQKYAESLELLQEAYAAALKTNDKQLIGEVTALLGINNLALGNYDVCLREFLEAERIFKELKLMLYLPEAVSNLAVIYRKLDLFGHSLLKHLEALAYAFQANNEYVIASTLLNCAAVLFEAGFPDKAFRTLDTVLLFCDKNKGDIKYENLRMVALNNKGTFYTKQTMPKEMLDLVRQARAVARKYSLTEMIDVIDSNIVTGLIGIKQYKEAHRLLKTILAKRKNFQDDQQVANLVKMGVIYRDYFLKPDDFLEYADKALKLAEKKQLVVRQVLIYNLLKEYYTKTSDTARLKHIDMRLKILEEHQRQNKQTSGMENLFDTNVMAVENRLMQEKQQPGFFARYDYLIGNFSYTQRGVTRHIPLRDIAFCEVRGNYLHIHTFTKDGNARLVLEQAHRLRKTMKDFESEITSSDIFFGRIHNSYIINLYWLPKNAVISGSSLTIGGLELPVSDTYRSSFKKKLNAFLEKEMEMA